jgi:F1F0 ATPase subunit 2
MTSGAWSLIFAGLFGGLLGAIFYGGLWWTIRLGAVSQRPAVWFLGSLLARMSIAVLGIYGVGRHSLPRMLICLLAFVSTRPLAIWLGRPARRGRGLARGMP